MPVNGARFGALHVGEMDSGQLRSVVCRRDEAYESQQYQSQVHALLRNDNHAHIEYTVIRVHFATNL